MDPPPVGPLNPASFQFVGFADLDAIHQRLRKSRVWSRSPHLLTIESGSYIPMQRRQTGQSRTWGGIIDADGRPVPLASLYRHGGKPMGGLPVDQLSIPTRYRDEDALNLGWLSHHFGHVLLESLARVWALREVAPQMTLLMHSCPDIAPHIAALLGLFGISSDRLIVPTEPTRFRRILVPEQLYEFGHSAHVHAASPYRAVADAVLSGDEAQSEQPLYLSRTKLLRDTRAATGESALESLLRDAGVRIVHPETIPFVEQIRLVNRHRDIIAIDGSAAHLVLFSRTSPRLHLLTDDNPNLDFFLVSAISQVPTTFVRCLTREGDDPRRRRVARRLDVAAASAYLGELVRGHACT